jgi:hypothetical protein
LTNQGSAFEYSLELRQEVGLGGLDARSSLLEYQMLMGLMLMGLMLMGLSG